MVDTNGEQECLLKHIFLQFGIIAIYSVNVYCEKEQTSRLVKVLLK